MKCETCDADGRLTQGPWPLAMSICFCDLCYEMESWAFVIWRETNPETPKVQCKVPVLEITGIPDDPESLSLDELKSFFREKISGNPRGRT